MVKFCLLAQKAPLLDPMFPTHLASLVQQLVLKLLDPQDLLEHLVELVFAQDELGSGAGCHALLRLSWVLISAVDGVKFSHPGTQHGLLAQTINLWQAPHTFLDMALEHLATV